MLNYHRVEIKVCVMSVSFHDHHLFLFLDPFVPWRFYDGMWHQFSEKRTGFW